MIVEFKGESGRSSSVDLVIAAVRLCCLYPWDNPSSSRILDVSGSVAKKDCLYLFCTLHSPQAWFVERYETCLLVEFDTFELLAKVSKDCLWVVSCTHAESDDVFAFRNHPCIDAYCWIELDGIVVFLDLESYLISLIFFKATVDVELFVD